MNLASHNTLAVLSGGSPACCTGGPQGPMWYLGASENPGQGENGYGAFETLKNDALKAAVEEPDQLKKKVLSSAASIAAAAIPIPVAGWIIAGVAAAASLLGVTIKGRTTHVPRYPDANSAGVQWAAKQWAIYRALPTDAQQFMVDRMYEFNVYMFGVFGTWWGGVAWIENQSGPGTLENFRLIERERAIKGPSGYWFEIIMASADATSVTENMQTWYFANYESLVLKPLNDYMLSKYNKTLDEYVESGGTLISPTSAGMYGWLAVAAVGGALLLARPKRRGR